MQVIGRFIASGCAALVVALAVLAASPELHHWVHGDKDVGTDDDCIVVLFAHGVTGAAAATILVVAALCFWDDRVAISIGPFLGKPRFQLPPACGPPLS